MSDSTFWFTKALYFMDHVVRLVPGDDAWDRASPCDGWTARHVLGHVIATQHYFVSAIEGRPPAMDPMREPDRHAGADPFGAWENARDTVLRALDRPGTADLVVSTVRGRQRVDDMIAFSVVENTVHSWDLAKALGVDDTLDHGLVSRSLDITDATGEALAAAGVFGTAVPVDAVDRQARLLGALGRRAEWRPA